MELIINNEEVTNDRNWRLSNIGCDTSRFAANPVLLYQHSTDHVIGRCTDLRIEGAQLLCSVEFDEEDALARTVKRKLETGFLRGVSPGFLIEKMSFGEEYDTVDAWELLEVSIVTVPSNRGALRLYSREGIPLDERAEEAYIHQLRATSTDLDYDMNNDNLHTPPPLPEVLSAKATEALGVTPHATPAELNARIEALADENAENRAKLEEIRIAERDALISKAVNEDRLPEIHRATFTALYDKEPELCKAVLSAMKVHTTLASQVVPTAEPSSDTRFDGDWDELDRKELLAALRAENPELFERKFREKFAVKLNGAKY